ncbi:MAG: GNAT family N-acetyltransferase [Actinomycetota bacterium]|nr:GNAT family N-acetyltransferase [Actinomycetota bacterium]
MKLDEAARVATESDTDQIVALARNAFAELSAQRGGAVWSRRNARVEPIDHDINQAIAESSAGGCQLVAAGTIDDVVVGYAVVRDETVADGGHLGVIQDLYVEPGARGVGVGEALMNLILAWATERHCFGVDSIALPGDRGTKNFFESFGLVARAIAVHRSLPSAPDRVD